MPGLKPFLLATLKPKDVQAAGSWLTLEHETIALAGGPIPTDDSGFGLRAIDLPVRAIKLARFLINVTEEALQ